MPIKIIIEASGSEDVKSAGNPLNTKEDKKEDDKKVDGTMSKEMAMITKFAISQAKSWSLQGIKSYSQFTGDTTLQKKAEFALGAVDNLASIYAGAKLAGGVGVGIVVAGMVAKEGMNAYTSYMNVKTYNRDLSIVTQGLGVRNINGGRYGT